MAVCCVSLQVSERLNQPGVAIGLAWTPLGGEIMFVEASRMEGEGQLTLTGQLGDVMKESAHLAISWLRSNAKRYQLTNGGEQGHCCHWHPAAANPATYSLGTRDTQKLSAISAALRMGSAPQCLWVVLSQLLPRWLWPGRTRAVSPCPSLGGLWAASVPRCFSLVVADTDSFLHPSFPAVFSHWRQIGKSVVFLWQVLLKGFCSLKF